MSKMDSVVHFEMPYDDREHGKILPRRAWLADSDAWARDGQLCHCHHNRI